MRTEFSDRLNEKESKASDTREIRNRDPDEKKSFTDVNPPRFRPSVEEG